MIRMKKLITVLMLVISGLWAAAQENLEDYNATRFTWGASFGSDIDLTGNDMSDVSLDAYFGVRMRGVQALGLGIGIDVPVSNSWRSYPLYIIMRTNFRQRPSLCFFDLRAGASVNLLEHDHKQTGTYASCGLGFQLASGRNFSSHLILAYTFTGRNDYRHGEEYIKIDNLHMATMRIGISF